VRATGHVADRGDERDALRRASLRSARDASCAPMISVADDECAMDGHAYFGDMPTPASHFAKIWRAIRCTASVGHADHRRAEASRALRNDPPQRRHARLPGRRHGAFALNIRVR